MDNNASTNEQHNDIIDESTNSSAQQQYVSMDDGNAEESNTDINISVTSTVDEDIGSNNRGGNETNNNTWSKDDPVIKIFPFSENEGLKIDISENDNPLFYFKLLVSDELLGGIVQRSNEYACRVIDSSRPLHRKSVLNKWKEVTLSEMKKFYGIVFHGTSWNALLLCILFKVSSLQK